MLDDKVTREEVIKLREEQAFELGMEKGIKLGIEKVRADERIENARKLKEKGISHQIITECLGLTEDEINAL